MIETIFPTFDVSIIVGLSHDEVSNIIRRSENKIDLITRKQLEDESKAGRQASKMGELYSRLKINYIYPNIGSRLLIVLFE